MHRQSEIDQEFARFFAAISARDENVEKGEIESEVKKIQAEAVRGAASETRLERLFATLKGMAPDIFDVVTATLASPHKGISEIARKVAARARQS